MNNLIDLLNKAKLPEEKLSSTPTDAATYVPPVLTQEEIIKPAPAVSRSVASQPIDDSVNSNQPKSLSELEAIQQQLSDLKTNYNKDLQDAEDRKFKSQIFASLGNYLPGMIAGATAMNTKAAVKPAEMPKVEAADPTARVDSRFKTEYENLIDQYKTLKKSNEPMTPYQAAMLQMMDKQYQRGVARDEDADKRFWAGHGQRDTRFNHQITKDSQLTDAQTKTITALSDAKQEVEALIPLAKKVKLGLISTPMNQLKNKFGQAPEYGELERNYSGVRNTIRNALFGSALTQTEKEEFDKELNEISFSDAAFDQNLKGYLNKLERKIGATVDTISKTQPLRTDSANRLITPSSNKTGPEGDFTEKNGKTYKWNPAVGKYQLWNK